MATTKLYLDPRSVNASGESPVKLLISHKGKSVLLSLNVYIPVASWDRGACTVVNHPSRNKLNTYLNSIKSNADMLILELTAAGKLGRMTAKELREAIARPKGEKSHEAVGLLERFTLFLESRNKPKTREVYRHTLKRILAFDPQAEDLSFEDITPDWLREFDEFLSETSPSANARAIHFRNIRAVFNDAIDNEITTAYPFRKFKIRSTQTRKRSLTVEQLRELFTYPIQEYQRQYVDMFKLIFYLVGINMIDLCDLQTITPDGRVEYRRAKTGRLYSIKVEPEAAEIIERYRGVGWLLDIRDRCKNYDWYRRRVNNNLRKIGELKIGKKGRKTIKPLYPDITTYWARHTWATIAASLDIPKETIAAALGHGGGTVTDIYIDFDRDKVDAANRRVLDWVLYGKR